MYPPQKLKAMQIRWITDYVKYSPEIALIGILFHKLIYVYMTVSAHRLHSPNYLYYAKPNVNDWQSSSNITVRATVSKRGSCANIYQMSFEHCLSSKRGHIEYRMVGPSQNLQYLMEIILTLKTFRNSYIKKKKNINSYLKNMAKAFASD